VKIFHLLAKITVVAKYILLKRQALQILSRGVNGRRLAPTMSDL
jgi:hypothetical protein